MQSELTLKVCSVAPTPTHPQVECSWQTVLVSPTPQHPQVKCPCIFSHEAPPADGPQPENREATLALLKPWERTVAHTTPVLAPWA